MATSVNHRGQRRRGALRSLLIWVPDTRHADFAEECRRQSKLVSASDALDMEFDAFTDVTLDDLDDEVSK